MFSFRNHLSRNDGEILKEIALSTKFFVEEEIQVVKDLVHENLTKGAIKSGYFFLLVENDLKHVIAFSCYGRIIASSHHYSLYWIVVSAAYQNQKIGRTLLQETEKHIQTLSGTRVYVETLGTIVYAPTRAFYLHNHYHIVAVLSDYFDKGQDKVILSKDL